jgi:hypothetical protein
MKIDIHNEYNNVQLIKMEMEFIPPCESLCGVKTSCDDINKRVKTQLCCKRGCRRRSTYTSSGRAKKLWTCPKIPPALESSHFRNGRAIQVSPSMTSMVLYGTLTDTGCIFWLYTADCICCYSWALRIHTQSRKKYRHGECTWWCSLSLSSSILAVRYGIGSSLGVNSLVLKLLIVPGLDRRRPSINLTRSSTHTHTHI